jgi:amidase
MLDCLAIPQVGDPFLIPKPDAPYTELVRRDAPRLRIGWSTDALMGFETDPGVRAGVIQVAKVLATMGHEVSEESPAVDGLRAMRAMKDAWFFGFDLRLEGYSARSGHKIGPDTLEPIVLMIYEHSKRMTAQQFMDALAAINDTRHTSAPTGKYDIWISPTTRASRAVGQPAWAAATWRSRTCRKIYRAIASSRCRTHLGTPAISLPLVMHSTACPSGSDWCAPSGQHVVLQLATALEAGDAVAESDTTVACFKGEGNEPSR